MNTEVIKNIQRLLPSMSKSHKKISQYILENYEKAAYMTASKLGETVGVSESTVVRYAVSLGYDGYPELQDELEEYLRTNLNSVQRMELSSVRVNNADVLSQVLAADIENISITRNEINQADFEKAVDLILGAGKIYILGLRSAAALSGFLGFYFRLVFDNVHIISANSESEIFEEMLRVSEKDVVIGISFPRYSLRVIKALQFANERKVKIVSITDSAASPLARFGTVSLFARSNMASFADSLVAPLSVINALIMAVSLRNQTQLSKTFSELEHLWEEYDVYAKHSDDEETV